MIDNEREVTPYSLKGQPDTKNIFSGPKEDETRILTERYRDGRLIFKKVNGRAVYSSAR